jgi:acetoin utilization deacetylase AcuC-like enzyme
MLFAEDKMRQVQGPWQLAITQQVTPVQRCSQLAFAASPATHAAHGFRAYGFCIASTVLLLSRLAAAVIDS